MKRLLSLLIVMASLLAAHAEDNPLWLRYSAIAPDGQSIAFSYQGELYVVSAMGGTARQLTTHPAYDAYPVWSPDGKQIAFASMREGSFDIYVIGIEGGAPRRLTTASGAEFPLTWRDNEHILFESNVMPTAEDIFFPGGYAQTYEVDTNGSRPRLYSAVDMQDLSLNSEGAALYHDMKGYEDSFRKHHLSPIARDIWLKQGDAFRKLTDFGGEDRTPRWVPGSNSAYYYLSEESGSFNIYRRNIDGSGKTQITHHAKNPVRFLSVAANGTLCYGFEGEIYTVSEGREPQKVQVSIVADAQTKALDRQVRYGGASEVAVSPNGKEVAFVMHGDVYVTSVEYTTTRRITDTPEQERNVSYSPDGKCLVYAAERGGLWQIYQSKISDKDGKSFLHADDIEEEQLVESDKTSQLPKYSPDGKTVAFLENRGTLRLIDVKSKKVTTAMDGKYMYSYSDGDVWFDWSPDSRWILCSYIGTGGWNSADIALVRAEENGAIHNLTESGYNEGNARWVFDGKAMLFESDREGYRSHGSWGAHGDAYIMFFDADEYEKFRMNKEERALLAEAEKKDKKDKDDEEKNEKKDEDKEKDKKVKPLDFDLDNCQDRVLRLTNHSSRLGDFVLNSDGTAIIYQAAFEGGFDLWKRDLLEGNTTLINKGFGGGGMVLDKDGKNVYLCTGDLKKYDIGENKVKGISFEAPFNYRPLAERQYIFNHIWQQVKDKFYDPDIHGVDWEGYRAHYERFLPYITNNFDFKDMLSEMLGELNASHTGARYYPAGPSLSTAVLGAFYDNDYEGDGLKIKEVIKGSPLSRVSINDKERGVKAGSIIEKIDGEAITAGMDYTRLLDGKAGKKVRLSIVSAKGKHYDVKVKALSRGDQNTLLYKRWVEHNRHLVDSLSGGQLAYVHVKSMNSESFRTVYRELLSDKNRNRKAAIVDERHNGGGWLHDDLCTLLSGKRYQDFVPHGQYVGSDPFNKWTKPSCVLICEDDYSNGHGFPWVYKTLGIGKLIGAPVAGTMTAVWWETLIDNSLVFGIPQVGCRSVDGVFGENTTLYPDIEVYNTPEDFINGYDRQLIRAVEEMMK